MTDLPPRELDGPFARLSDYIDERLLDADGEPVDPTILADERVGQLAEFRQRLSDQHADALAPGPPPGPNWISIGPAAVLEGQAATKPVVSGRVPSLAISNDGQRVYAATANGGVWASLDRGRTWRPKSDEFDLDPTNHRVDTLACGAIGLVDGGQADQDRLFLGTGEGFTSYRLGGALRTTAFLGVGPVVSINGGNSWETETANPTLNGHAFYAIAVDPADPDHVVGATTNGLYQRTVGPSGPVWTRQVLPVGSSPQPDVTSVVAALDSVGATRWYAATEAGAVLTASGSSGAALTWTVAAAAGFPTSNVGRMTLTASTGATALYVLIAQPAPDDQLLGVYRLDPGDASPQWRKVDGVSNTLFGDTGQQGSYDQALVVDPIDQNRFYVGGSIFWADGEWSAGIYRCDVSTQGSGTGRTYRTSAKPIGQSVHSDVHSLVLSPASSRELWCGCDGGVFQATDVTAGGDRLFEARNTGLNILTANGLSHQPTLPGFAMVGVQDNGGCRYGTSEVWEHVTPGDGGASVVAWSNPPATPGRVAIIYTRTTIRRIRFDADRYDMETIGPSRPDADPTLFYPPMVGSPPSGTAVQANRLAIGTRAVWLSDDFGTTWTTIDTGTYTTDQLPSVARSMTFHSHTRLFVGTRSGTLHRFDQGGTWSRTNHGRPGPVPSTAPLTSIAVDPAVPAGTAVYCTFGGLGGHARVWHFNPPTGWQPRSTGLLNSQHNAIVADPSNPAHLYVGADIGVWRSTTSGTTWTVFSNNLPDASVIDLDLVNGDRLLRATTHGRGVFEIPLTTDGVNPPSQPAVELVIRSNRVDTGRRPAPTGMADPFELGRTLTAFESPDVRADAPDRRGRLRVDPNGPVDPVMFARDLPADGTILANSRDRTATTKVYVRVANLGPGEADDVAVTLLLGRVTDDARPALPAGFDQAIRDGVAVSSADWQTVARRTVSGVAPTRPGIVGFDVPSDLLPPANESNGDQYVLFAAAHHASDPFTLAAATTDPDVVVANNRQAAFAPVAVATARGAAAQGQTNPPPSTGSGSSNNSSGPATSNGNGSGSGDAAGGTGASVLTPLATALLAHKRLADLVEDLERKVATGNVQPTLGGFSQLSRSTRTEHQVLGLARRALANYRGGGPAPLPASSGLHGISSYVVLGTLGFELPRNLDLLRPSSGWLADSLQRSGPDPQRSLVAVRSAEFALASGVPGTDLDDDTKDRIRAFGAGALAATAAGVVVNPLLANLLAAETNRDWHPGVASQGALATDRLIQQRLLPEMGRADLLSLWPAVADVPEDLWSTYLAALGDIHGGLDDRRLGFAEFENRFAGCEAPTADRLRNAYALFRDDVASSSMSWTGWWGWLSLYTLASPLGLAICRAMPNAKNFFRPGEPVDERAWFELMMVSMGTGGIGPFISSMYLWSKVDEHSDVFVNALLLFLARAGLTSSAIGSSTSDLDDGVRWGLMFVPMLGTDVYAGIRSAAAGDDPPGDRIVFGLQLNSALSGLLSAGVGGVIKAVVDETEEEWPGWVLWGVHTLGMWLGVGMGVGAALEGKSWRSWFVRDGPSLGLVDGLRAGGSDPAEPRALANLYDDSTLWSDPQVAAETDLAARAYPSGMRALIRMWYDPAEGTLEIRHDGSEIYLRPSTGPEVPVPVPFDGLDVEELAQRLSGALEGLEAEVVDPDEGSDDPRYQLPVPATLADPGDRGPIDDHDIEAGRYQRVGATREDAYVLRHGPRAELATTAGLAGPSRSTLDRLPIVPQASLGDIEQSGLGAAADLAVLLALGAVPTFEGGSFTVPYSDWRLGLGETGRKVDEVHQVFRRWNLSERRANEWYQTVSGGAISEKEGAPEETDPLMRPYPPGRQSLTSTGEPLATAMGWVPLLRAWRRIVADPGLDAEADVAMPYTPLVDFGDGRPARPTNRQLSEAIRFLLDLKGS